MSINLFDANFYRAANSDLANLNDAQSLSHFQTFGLNEGRAFSQFANLNFYRSSNADLASFNNRQTYEHLQNNGVAEGRRFSAFVDLNFYKAANVDLAGLNNEQLFEHLRNNGVGEGRQFSFAFDVNYYRNVNSDLASANLNNRQLLEHFEIYGLGEGRASSPFFDVNYYRSRNADLASLTNTQSYDHFISSGLQEGRPASGAANVDYAGNTLDTARRIAIASNKVTFRDFVGSNDSNDYYRFSISETRSVNAEIISLNASGDAKAQLLNSSGVPITDNNLGPGTYLVQVSQGTSTANTAYTLNLFSTVTPTPPTPPTPLPPPTQSTDPGSTFGTASNLGTLTGSGSQTGSLGGTDIIDYYKFTLSQSRTLTLNLFETSTNLYSVDMALRNSTGTVLVDAQSGDLVTISRELSAGDYFLQIDSPYSGLVPNATYTLEWR